MIAASRYAVDWAISGALIGSLVTFVAVCEVRYRRARRFWREPWTRPDRRRRVG